MGLWNSLAKPFNLLSSDRRFRDRWPLLLGGVFLSIVAIVAIPVFLAAGLSLLGQIVAALILAPVYWLYFAILDRPLSALSRVSERMPKGLQWVLAAGLYGLGMIIAFLLVR